MGNVLSEIINIQVIGHLVMLEVSLLCVVSAEGVSDASHSLVG